MAFVVADIVVVGIVAVLVVGTSAAEQVLDIVVLHYQTLLRNSKIYAPCCLRVLHLLLYSGFV